MLTSPRPAPLGRPPWRHGHRALAGAIETYLDGEADPLVARMLRHHLGRCWHCSEDAEWLLLIKAALRDIGQRRPTSLAAARLERFTQVLAGVHRHGPRQPGVGTKRSRALTKGAVDSGIANDEEAMT